MASAEMKKNLIIGSLVVLVVLFGIYQYNPYLFNFFTSEGFESEEGESKEGEPKEDEEGIMPKLEGFYNKASQGLKASMEGFTASAPAKPEPAKPAAPVKKEEPAKPAAPAAPEGFADLNEQGPNNFASVDAPAGCYPRDQLTPSELLPKDMNSIWAEQNPMGPGSLKGKNFLSAGALIGVNTVGQSLRNANLQVRSEPPNPQVAVSIFNQSTISPDVSHRPLEIGS